MSAEDVQELTRLLRAAESQRDDAQQAGLKLAQKLGKIREVVERHSRRLGCACDCGQDIQAIMKGRP